MKIEQTMFYKYRSFSTTTLESLCHDTVYFSSPSLFNDPLDCNPTLDCDSSKDELRDLLEFFVARRAEKEVLSGLSQAEVKGERAEQHALNTANGIAKKGLNDIAYQAKDPYYSDMEGDVESWLLVSKIESEMNKHYEKGVCCFSTSYENPLLWSHYGDQHHGLCIGYSVNREPLPVLKEVVYDGKRSILTSTLVKAFLVDDEHAKSELDREVLLHKAGCWKYEKEWRLISEQGVQDSPLLLEEVTFGLRCNSAVRHAVVSSLEGRDNDIKFYEMYIVRGSYELQRRLLDTCDLGTFLPNTAMSAEEMFGDINKYL